MIKKKRSLKKRVSLVHPSCGQYITFIQSNMFTRSQKKEQKSRQEAPGLWALIDAIEECQSSKKSNVSLKSSPDS